MEVDIMANNIEQTKRNIDQLAKSTKQFADIFNGASDQVTSNINEMGIEFSDLRAKMNVLKDESEQLRKSIKVDMRSGNAANMDKYLAKFQQLDKETSSLSAAVVAHIKAMNSAFSDEFDSSWARSLKSQMNGMASFMKQAEHGFGKLGERRPDLWNFSKEFIKQNDIIENEMGRLTRYGKVRSEVEKSLGFNVTRGDIADELNKKQADLSKYKDIKNSLFGGMDIKKLSVGDREYYDEWDTEVKNLETAIKALDSSVGTKVTGYVDLFNRAYNLMQSANINKGLIEEVAFHSFPRFSEDKLKSISATDFNKYIDELNASSDWEFGGRVEAIKEETAATEDLKTKLKEVLDIDTTISKEKKEELINDSKINGLIEQRKKTLGYVKNDLEALGRKTINVNSTPIKVTDANGRVELENYKVGIAEAVEDVKLLKKEQEATSAKLSTKGGLLGTSRIEYNRTAMDQVKGVLESGYRININAGTEAFEQLKLIESTFKSMIDGYKNTKIAVVDDTDVADAVKIDALEEAITKEKRAQESEAKAIASYEQNKVRYLELQRQSAEKQKGIMAYEYMMQKELSAAKSASEKKDITNKYTGRTVYNAKARSYTGSNGLITTAKSNKAKIDKEVAKLQQEFNKYKLEIPVTPSMKNARTSMQGDAYKKYLQYKQEDSKQFKGVLGGFDQETTRLTAEANKLGVNVEKTLSRLSAVSKTAKNAFNVDNVERAIILINEYQKMLSGLKDKVTGASKAQEIAAQREKEAIEQLLDETKRYVSTQEAMSGKKMPIAEQVKYYTQQLGSFKQGTREYIEVLKMLRQAEDQAQRASQDRLKAIVSIIKNISSAINNAVNKIVSVIRRGMGIISTVTRGTIKVFTTVKDTITRLIGLFGSFGNRIKQAFGFASTGANGANRSFNILKGTATELYSKIRLLQMAFNSLFNNQQVNNAMELYQSVYSLKNIVGGALTQDTIDWANKMEFAFGLSAKQLIADLNELSGVLYGLGMKSQDVAKGSQNILMIGRYLAFMGAAGGDVNVVMGKIVSGMKGMTASIDDLGLSVREAQMDQFLKDLKAQGGEYAKIGKSFANLNEEARVYIRYASLIQQFTSKYDMLDFARSLDTVTGRISILKQSIHSLGTTIGQVLVTALSGVSQYIVVVVRFIEKQITRLINYLNSIFGFNLDINLWSGMNDGVSDTVNSVEDLNKGLSETEKAAKKAKESIADFDRITSLSKKSGDSDNGLDGFDYSSLMASAIEDLNKLAEEATQNYIDSLNDKFADGLKKFKKTINKAIKDLTGRQDFDIEFDSTKAKESLKGILSNLRSVIKNSGLMIIEIGLKIADDVNIGKLLNSLLELLRAVTGLATAFTEVLRPAMSYLYDTYLSKYIEAFGVWLVEAIDKAIVKIDEFAEKIRSGDYKATVDKLVETFKTLWQLFDGEPVSLEDTIKLNEFEKAHPIISNLVKILGTLKDILVVLYNEVLKPLLLKLAEFMGSEFLPWLLEKLQQLRDYIDENSDKIVTFLEKVGSIAWTGFQKFVELVGKLIAFVVEHPNAVIAFFAGLLALKVTSWLGGVTGGIADLIIKFSELKALTSGGGTLATLLGGGGAAAAGAGAAGAGAAAGGAGAAGGAAAAGGIALGPILAIVAAVAALAAAFVDLCKTSEQFRETFKTFGESIKKTFGSVVEKVKEGFESIKTAWDNFYKAYESSGLKDMLAGLFEAIGYIVTAVVNLVVSALGTLIKFIENIIADAINIISGVFDVLGGLGKILEGIFTLDSEKIWEGIKQVGAGIVEIIGGILQAIWDVLGGAVDIVLDIINSIFLGVIDGIQNAWNDVWDAVRTFFDNLIKSVKDFLGIHSPSTVFAEIGGFLIEGLWQGIDGMFGWLVDNVVKAFTCLLDRIKNVFSGMGQWFSDTFTKAKDFAVNAWSDIKSKFTSIKENVTGAFSTLKDNISTTFSNAKSAAVGAWDDAKSKFATVSGNIYGAFEGLKGKFKGLWTGIKDTALSILGGIGNTVSSIWSSVKNGVSNLAASISGKTTTTTAPSVRYHAKGGSEKSGQVFVANENGAELVGNITGTGGADVANNKMIIQALKLAMSEGMAEPLFEILSQLVGSGTGDVHYHIGENGLNMIDQATLAKAQSMLAPYGNKNNMQKANNGFVMT